MLKRAQYFITCKGKALEGLRVSESSILRGLISENGVKNILQPEYEQLSFFDESAVTKESVMQCLTGQM
ncbi:hypothetical protein D3C87_2006320 [compost metagenome]